MPASNTRFVRMALPAAALLIYFLGTSAALAQQIPRTTPSQAYYQGIEELYEGDYRDAERVFRREAKNSIKIGVTVRWIDAICYHAMWGEVFYHQGRLGLALQEFDHACSLFLQYPQWMLRVSFKQAPREDTNRLRRQKIPWGTSERTFTLGHFPTQMLINQGDLQSANRAVQRGGIVQQAQLWKINVIEVVRATALAIRRRNELLGPLSAQDKISRELVSTLSRGGSPPNHWSSAWVQLQLGLAKAGLGKYDEALRHLSRSERVQGKFDHPLTCIALLEQGRIQMNKGNSSAAAKLFAEASYSAFYYEDPNIIDDAFRYGSVNRLASRIENINTSLTPAIEWARRERYDHIFARLNLAMAEEHLTLGNWQQATTVLATGQSRLRDAKIGVMGNWSQYLNARILQQQGHKTAPTQLAQAIEGQIPMSVRNFQIGLTNLRYDQQQIRARSVVDVYQSLLSNPTPKDWLYRPLETMALLKTPHHAAFDRWLSALLSRKDQGTALEVADLAKRRSYRSSLAWGGRLAALRDTLEAPEHTLSHHSISQRKDLLLKYPAYAEEIKAGEQLQASLQKGWVDGLDKHAERDLTKTWRQWSTSLGRRENMLRSIGLARIAADPVFPPVSTTAELQSKLQPGQAVVVFHNTPEGLLGFLVTAKGSTAWNCGPMVRLTKPLNDFLRSLGNYDANHSLTSEQLQSDDWRASGAKLAQALFEGSSLDLGATDELIVVPDGLVWYVPFGALPFTTDDRSAPLVSFAKLRMVPTMGLAIGHEVPWRRVQRTGFAGGNTLPGDSKELQNEALETLRTAVPNPIAMPSAPPIPTPQIVPLLEALVVLDSIDLDPSAPMAWSPAGGAKPAKRNSLSDWLTLPQFGPQRILLPAVHTIAERGGRTSKRKTSKAIPGNELFLASCAMMSTGAQTILLSRWSVTGQSTLDIMREFVQELPHTSAADAWQRSIEVASELTIDPDVEPRIKSSADDPLLTAAHPFFWAGYLLIDTGAPAPGEADETPVAQVGAAE